MGLFDKIGDTFNEKVDSMKKEKAAKDSYYQENDSIVKSFSKTGTAGITPYNDNDGIILIKPNAFGRTYAVHYDTIKSVRMEEHKEEVVSSNTKSKEKEKRKNVLGRAVVGTVLMPGVGTVIGAATAKKQKKSNSNTEVTSKINITRKLILTRDDLYVSNMELDYDDALFYKLEEIIKQNAEGKESETMSSDDMDNLLKLKSLLDAGILTEEEYEIKKKNFMK